MQGSKLLKKKVVSKSNGLVFSTFFHAVAVATNTSALAVVAALITSTYNFGGFIFYSFSFVWCLPQNASPTNLRALGD